MSLLSLQSRFGCRALSVLLLSASILPGPAQAASVALATAPLANATTTTVLPNLLFVLDNSGSMSQDFTPDYLMNYNIRNDQWTGNGTGSNAWNAPQADERNCRDSADEDGVVNTALTSMNRCVVGDVPYMSSAINVQYYNPAIRYQPGVNSDGSSFPSQTDPTSVLSDGYGKHTIDQLGNAIASINLTTNYPDRVWCTTNNPTAGNLVDTAVCRKNSNYLYPDATFKYGRDNNATTTSKDVLGVFGAPYYYSVVVTEYCSEAELKNCIASSVPSGAYTFPASSRWCNSSAMSNCQSTKTSTYIYPRYPGVSITAVAATGSLTLNNRSAGSGTAGRSVSNLKVNGVDILGPVTISGAAGMSSGTLAANIAAQINTYNSNPEFTASAAGDVITLTSTAAAGASANGTVAYTSIGSAVASKVNASGGVTGASAAPYTWARTDIVPATTSYPKGTARTDCAGATCTYAEEVTNFGNWYAYYRTRMQSMKSSVSLAFQPIGSNYRVGFMNICKGDYLAIAPFDNSVVAVPGVAASGRITLNNRSAGSGTNGRTVTSITVGGVEILGATVSGAVGMSSATLASNIADQINSYASNPEYTATVSGNKVTFTATVSAGANGNGTVAYNHTSSAVNSKVNASGGVTAIGQKSKWYSNLFNTTATGCGTPLRSALATAGRIFAGKELSTAGSTSGADIDPVQYSCQQNFTLLTTDGYWNGSAGVDLSGGAMANMDSDSATRPMYEGPTASSDSLADVAKYYYDTDLRDATLSNCLGSLGLDVCANNVFISSTDNNRQQHMTTFTLGLGVDGTLSYRSDYQTATSGDFYNLKNGLGAPTVNWPKAQADQQSAVDDLWHAAVNGRGQYFSAKDPSQLASGLNQALAAIGSKVGAASAAATSTLNPVSGDNFAYVASYSTIKWVGNLEARTINISTGSVSETASWCVETIPAATCSLPSTIVVDNSNSSLVYNCVTPGATIASCPAPGVLDGTDCKVQMPAACTGTMPTKIAASSDTRTIYKVSSGGGLEPFVYANLNAADFTATGLSQWSTLTATQKTAAAGANLVNYLRGQTGFEDRTSNAVNDRLYRFREATMGDALESQPIFVGQPVFDYTDPGYAAFKAAQATRNKTVFIGTNDGMLHAFNADTGVERWAFVPTVVIPKMWKLADSNYANLHTNYVNGSPLISDICTANCTCDTACVAGGGAAPVWKTILVGGLNAGGRSFYAFDVTDPASPSLLWEVSSATAGFSNLGYSYARPIVTKKIDGSWVVLLTSGYNNTTPGDGRGYLFVLNANTGALISALDTGVGDTTTPSGLAKVTGWNDFPGVDNTVGYVYGGDLFGNLWRFDINAGGTPFKFATLKDDLGNTQPVTTHPVLAKVLTKRLIIVGTGKYLEVSDLTDTSKQTLYAISDADETVTLTDARTALQSQTLTVAASRRSGTTNAVDFSNVRGWYIDLGEITPPSATPAFVGERINIDMRLVGGILIAPTIVPSNTVCSPGGYGWLNYFNYETGGPASGTSYVSSLYDAPIVGVNVFYIGGNPKVGVVTATNPTPTLNSDVPSGAGGTTSGFTGTRVMWREIIQ